MKTNFMKNRDPAFRVMPQTVEAEESILSACLLGFETEACELLEETDFYREAHRLTFMAIAELHSKRQPVALLSVAEHLRGNGNLKRVGGAVFLATLTETIPVAVNIPHYCGLIRQAATRRRMIIKCNELAALAYDEPDFETLLTNAQRAFSDVDSDHGRNVFTSYGELAEIMPEKWELLGQDTGITGVPSGLADVDKLTGGFQPSDLIILAARPGMGKSALALNIAEAAASHGFQVAIFSLEMSKSQLYCRQTAKTARIDGQKFRLGGIKPHEWQKILDSQSRLHGLPVHIDDTPRLHYMEIVRRSGQAIREYGVKLVVIDYLQLIRGDGGQRKDLEIADITGALKGLAKDLNVPVVLLSQLNRAVEGRDNKRPGLSDLRESGAIEQDSDIVSFLYRDQYYYPNTEEPGIAELSISKHRNGPTGIVKLRWIDWRSCFEDL
ncbi:MAG: replicative DNA helicase [Desulfosarcina sp.]|nr:replicative DNA helicase [Desulfosarcina sp.]MBC2744150.1 replicative DNA helicase [Desulfosarcina sp.]MBC2767059.1 replicative DNA helicase [Desulfosarcina sp.]